MKGIEREVWPIFAWLFGIFTAVTIALIVLGLWVDPRFGQLCLFAVPLAALAGVASLITWEDVSTYTKRPRGWRKLRRDAERQAYITQLERELGLDQ